MQQLSVGCDAHKHYSQLEVQDDAGLVLNRVRIDHHQGVLSFFSRVFPEEPPSRWKALVTGTGSPTRSKPRAAYLF
jgi:hypothetical protein